MSARGQFDLVGHTLIRYEELSNVEGANNWIVTSENSGDDWSTALMKQIGDWRAVLRSTYIRWAMAINGLYVAAAKYEADASPKKFTVNSIRTDPSGRPQQQVIAEYSFKEAAGDHLKIQPMLCAHGFIDMYAGLEEMIFGMYRKYLTTNPDHLMEGASYKDLRRLRNNAQNSPEEKAAWEEALRQRLDTWQRNKLYDGLDKVLLAFFQNAGLKTPAGYTLSTVETWSESIAGISLIRNLLIHGESHVPQELEHFCQKPHGLGFQFKAGGLLRLTIIDLQLLELFCDTLLTAFNLSLMEFARPVLRAEAVKRSKKH